MLVKKLGQPVPLSNFISEVNTGSAQPMLISAHPCRIGKGFSWLRSHRVPLRPSRPLRFNLQRWLVAARPTSLHLSAAPLGLQPRHAGFENDLTILLDLALDQRGELLG